MLLDVLNDDLLKILIYSGVLSLVISYFSTEQYKYLESLSIFTAVAL